MFDTRSDGKHDVVVTHYEGGRSFELISSALPGTKMAIRATITPMGSGSRITQGFEPRGLLSFIVGPMICAQILKTFSAVLVGLKERQPVADPRSRPGRASTRLDFRRHATHGSGAVRHLIHQRSNHRARVQNEARGPLSTRLLTGDSSRIRDISVTRL